MLNSGFNHSEGHGDASSASGDARLQHDGARVWLAIKRQRSLPGDVVAEK